MSEELETTAIISIGGKEVSIKKLRAGKFYEAASVVLGLFKRASKMSTDVKQKGTSLEPGQDNQLPDVNNVDMENVFSMFTEYPQDMIKFVAICSEMTEDEIKEQAYPEEINEAFGVCLELNNIMENLKNSVAPIEKLGGALATKTESPA